MLDLTVVAVRLSNSADTLLAVGSGYVDFVPAKDQLGFHSMRSYLKRLPAWKFTPQSIPGLQSSRAVIGGITSRLSIGNLFLQIPGKWEAGCF